MPTRTPTLTRTLTRLMLLSRLLRLLLPMPMLRTHSSALRSRHPPGIRKRNRSRNHSSRMLELRVGAMFQRRSPRHRARRRQARGQQQV